MLAPPAKVFSVYNWSTKVIIHPLRIRRNIFHASPHLRLSCCPAGSWVTARIGSAFSVATMPWLYDAPTLLERIALHKLVIADKEQPRPLFVGCKHWRAVA
jgi:hypothetical protein